MKISKKFAIGAAALLLAAFASVEAVHQIRKMKAAKFGHSDPKLVAEITELNQRLIGFKQIKAPLTDPSYKRQISEIESVIVPRVETLISDLKAYNLVSPRDRLSFSMMGRLELLRFQARLTILALQHRQRMLKDFALIKSGHASAWVESDLLVGAFKDLADYRLQAQRLGNESAQKIALNQIDDWQRVLAVAGMEIEQVSMTAALSRDVHAYFDELKYPRMSESSTLSAYAFCNGSFNAHAKRVIDHERSLDTQVGQLPKEFRVFYASTANNYENLRTLLCVYARQTIVNFKIASLVDALSAHKIEISSAQKIFHAEIVPFLKAPSQRTLASKRNFFDEIDNAQYNFALLVQDVLKSKRVKKGVYAELALKAKNLTQSPWVGTSSAQVETLSRSLYNAKSPASNAGNRVDDARWPNSI